MKTWLISVVAVGCGLLGGTGASIWQLGWSGSGDPLDARGLMTQDGWATGDKSGRSQVVVGLKQDGEIQRGVSRVKFDRQPLNSKGHAEFVFFNEGNAPLKLRHRRGDSSCECAIAELSEQSPSLPGSVDEREVAAGEQAVVKLTWDTQYRQGPYRHHAIIRTNDPNNPRVHLQVEGEVVQGLTFVPEDLAFGEVHHQEEKTLSFRVIAYDREAMQIKSCELVDDKLSKHDDELANHLKLTHEKLSAKQLLDSNAVSGHLIHATLKPGLRLGWFRTRIRVTTNLPHGGTQHLEMHGTVVGDIAIAQGPGWLSQLQLLHMGQIERQSGGAKTLYLLVRGPQRNDIQIKVAKTIPAALKATVEKPRTLKTLVRWPVRIEVPKGTPVMNHQEQGSYGKVILETTHPDEKEKVIKVSFEVN